MNDHVDPTTQGYIEEFHRRSRARAAFWRQAIPILALARAKKEWEAINSARKRRRRFPIWLGLGVFLLLAGAGVGFLMESVLPGDITVGIGEPSGPQVAPALVSPTPPVQATPSRTPYRLPKELDRGKYQPL